MQRTVKSFVMLHYFGFWVQSQTVKASKFDFQGAASWQEGRGGEERRGKEGKVTGIPLLGFFTCFFLHVSGIKAKSHSNSSCKTASAKIWLTWRNHANVLTTCCTL